jgi:DNA primase
MGAKLSDNQTRWINSANKTPILVIDRDSSGQRNVAVALRNKWHAAFPRLASAGWWDADVKDTAEAVKRYGRLYTLQSILKTATNDPRKIEVWSKLLI